MSTRSPAIVGDDFTSFPVLNVHARDPSRAWTAWTTPARSPTYTRSPPTAGDDSPISLPVAYFQRSLPLSRSTASRSPLAAPTYTAPSAIAAEDSIPSGASYVHRSVRR